MTLTNSKHIKILTP